MKRALIVGINYVGTGHELHGCINDAHNMEALLRDQYKFNEIKLILEQDATTAGIKSGMNWLTTYAVPGDVLVMHYSGHGSQLPSRTEADGYEEIICPVDLNWFDKIITDADLKACFTQVTNGVNVTVILDCCHSGTGLNQDGSYVTAAAKESSPLETTESRFLPPPLGLVSSRTHVVNWNAARDINSSALLIAGCRADQTSADAFINNVPQGAATWALISAVKAHSTISYRSLVDTMTMYMISGQFEQRPELDGSSNLYDIAFLEPFAAAVLPVVTDIVVPTPEPVVVPTPEPEVTPIVAPQDAQKIQMLKVFGYVAIIVLVAYIFIH